jgi:hypothetical protein
MPQSGFRELANRISIGFVRVYLPALSAALTTPMCCRLYGQVCSPYIHRHEAGTPPHHQRSCISGRDRAAGTMPQHSDTTEGMVGGGIVANDPRAARRLLRHAEMIDDARRRALARQVRPV